MSLVSVHSERFLGTHSNSILKNVFKTFSSNGNNSPKSNSKVERSSLSIHIGNSNSTNTIESNKEGSSPVFDRGKDESVRTQHEGGSDIDRYERPPFERILNDDYAKINYGYDRRPKNSRKLKDVLSFCVQY